MMLTVVITDTAPARDESAIITDLLDSGAIDRVHLRRPGCGEAELRCLIEQLPRRLYGRLSLHDHLRLATAYGIGGIHLNSRNTTVPEGFRGTVSRSCHSPEELTACPPECTYAFLSPVFDSISKPGYRGRLDELTAAGCDLSRAVALGGVTPQDIPLLREAGFGGIAMLGHVWRDCSRLHIAEIINTINKYRQCYNS